MYRLLLEWHTRWHWIGAIRLHEPDVVLWEWIVLGSRECRVGSGRGDHARLPERLGSTRYDRSSCLTLHRDSFVHHAIQPLAAMLCMRSDITLRPGEVRTLRFGYGYMPAGKTMMGMLEKYVDGSPSLQTARAWQASATRIKFPRAMHGNATTKALARIVEREVVWRSCALSSSSVYHDYYQRHVIPQGSEYLYLSGADGAPRDQALFAAASAYTNPQVRSRESRLSVHSLIGSFVVFSGV